MNVDPLAEEFISTTPYNYTLNNPISNIDPDGRFTLEGQAAQNFVRDLQGQLASNDNEHDPPPGGNKAVNFFRGYGDGFYSGWNSTKNFVKSLGTEEGWLDLIRSTEMMYSPAINSEGDSYVKEERVQMVNSASNTLNNLDKLTAYDWGYGLGYASEKLTEMAVMRKSFNMIKSAKPFSLNEGFGVFGKEGLKFGNYRMDIMYANPKAGSNAGTLFSLKQMKQGGTLWRWDYGAIHGSTQMKFHSTVRFQWNGVKYGSTAQRTWYPSSLKAPFFTTLKK